MVSKIQQNSGKLLAICFAFCFIFENKYVLAALEPQIRVLIYRDDQLRVRSDGSIQMIFKHNDSSYKRIKGLTIKKRENRLFLTFDANKDKILKINNQDIIRIKSKDKRGIWIGSKRYSGIINIKVLDNEVFVVNKIGIENYLSSVVGSEMPHKWHFEALKAQAIASRTYALKKKGNLLFDIDSTKYDQVYNGLESSTHKTRRAVNKTRSLVIIHNNKLINALFHSSSGGMTENSEEVWSNKYPYLRSVKDFDHKNPKLYWEKRFFKKDLENLFPDLGEFSMINIIKFTNSGRIKTLKINGLDNSKVLSGKDFRKRLKLKSTLFRFKLINNKMNGSDIKNKNSKILFEPYLLVKGLGSGHGVGMSQWGARFMAKKGYKANQILKHFYTGVEIKPFRNIYK